MKRKKQHIFHYHIATIVPTLSKTGPSRESILINLTLDIVLSAEHQRTFCEEISVLISRLQRQLQFDLKEFACKDLIAKESFISRVLWSSVFQPFAILIPFKKSTEDIDSKIVIISLLTESLVLREL